MARLCAAAVFVALVACSGGDAAAPANGPAGKVTAVTGEVTAQRANAEVRALAVNDQVFGDDTITTAGEDASVTIVLTHNAAAWTLSGSESKRIDKTAAWRAPKGAKELDVVEGPDRTAAAGRHAERSATDRPKFADEDPAEPAPEPEAAPAPAATAAPPPPPRKAKRARKKKKSKSGGGNHDDPLGGFDFDSNRAPPPPPKGSSAPVLSRAQVQEGIARVKGRVSTCATTEADGPKLIKVTFTISSAGKVTSARATGAGADTKTAACVIAAVRTATFPASRDSTTVTLPFKL